MMTPPFRSVSLFGVLCILIQSPMVVSGQLEDVSVDHLLEVSTAASWFGCGLSTADFDGDGWDDVTAGTSDGPVELYKGGPDGLAHHMTIDHDVESKGVLWVDVDNDGDLDLFVGVLGVGLFLYIQQDDGTLIEEGESRGIPLWPGWDVRGISAVDYDNDLDLDVYVSSYHDDMDTVLYENLMLRNDGGGYFSDQTQLSGLGNGYKHSFQGAWFDYDEDGDQDLWVINDRAIFRNALYRNVGNGVFFDIAEDVGADVGIEAMSATLCDPDNDSDWDMYMTNIENNPNVYLRNTDGSFTDVAAMAGIASMQYGWGTLAIDLDGDMLQDLMVATYRFPNSNPYDNHLYMNQGNGGGFTDEIDDWPNEQYQLYCLGQLDLDNDRVPDIIGHGNAYHAQVLRNTNPDGAARFALNLVGTTSNSHAIGALIRAWSGGVCQMRQVSAGCDYMTQHSYTQFFGFGSETEIDSLWVRWPSGLEEVVYGIPTDSELTLIEGVQNIELETIPGACSWHPDMWVVPEALGSADLNWNGGPVFGDTLVADSSGTWTLEATWWNGLGSWSIDLEAQFGAMPQLNLTSTHPECHGGLGSLSWSSPESEFVTWQGEILAAEGMLDSVAVGHHLMVGHIEAGCEVEASVEIVEPDSLVLEITTSDAPCFGEMGSMAISASGGTPPLSVDFGSVDLEAVWPGTYPVALMDSLGCLLSLEAEVMEPPLLESTAAYVHSGISDSALVTVDVLGGTPPYSVSWSGPVDSEGWTLAPSSLGWLVEDANGCLNLGVVQVPENPSTGLSVSPEFSGQCWRMDGVLHFGGVGPMVAHVDVWDVDGRSIGHWHQMVIPTEIELSTSRPVIVRLRSAQGDLLGSWLR